MAKRPRHPQPSAPRPASPPPGVATPGRSPERVQTSDERRRWTLSRLWAIALVTFRQGLRTRLWILVPPAILVMILADLSSPRFDPVFETVPATISMSLLVMAVLALVVGTFFATYSLPAELESKVAQSVVTKPVGRAEIVGGKTLGMSLVVLLMVGCVGVAGYAYTLVRASSIQSLAGERLTEATPRAAYPADLNALQAVATNGPLETYRYYAATSGPEIGIDAGPEVTASPDVRWILGETGMRLAWDLSRTPLQEWAASAPLARQGTGLTAGCVSSGRSGQLRGRGFCRGGGRVPRQGRRGPRLTGKRSCRCRAGAARPPGPRTSWRHPPGRATGPRR